jgi:hypothetical protein
MRKVVLTVGLMAALSLVAGPAFGHGHGGTQPVKLGAYGAAPAHVNSYSVGEWDVTRKHGVRKIVASATYGGIYYPDAGKCDPYNVPLKATSIRISGKGRFHIKENTPVDTGHGIKKIHVDWAGHWTTSKTVKGTIKLGFKNCTDKRDFTGGLGGG